jgi:hypothetical protein
MSGGSSWFDVSPTDFATGTIYVTVYDVGYTKVLAYCFDPSDALPVFVKPHTPSCKEYRVNPFSMSG